MVRKRMLMGMVLVLITSLAIQPVAAYYICYKNDSTNYNYLDENFAAHYTNEDVNTNNGKMKAHGANGYWDGLYTVFEEVGMDFDAPEAGDCKVAAEWQANYHIWTGGDWFRWGVASIKVEYILYSPSHERLESRTVFYRQANKKTGPSSISGTDHYYPSTWYQFTTSLVQGWAYTVAVRLTFSMESVCDIEGVTSNTPASINVDYVYAWNYPENP
jgi:hypothetical protein